MAFRFNQFKVYKDALVLHKKIVILTKTFSGEFYYLKDQLRRSSLSIVLQIAEGSAKRSDKDFNRYVEMGMGSANETAAGLNVCYEQGLTSEKEYRDLLLLCEEIVNQLGGLSKKLLVVGG